MSAQEGFVLLGTDLAVKAINGWREDKKKAEKGNLGDLAAQIFSAARANCPVDTGDLRDSGALEVVNRGEGFTEFKITFGGGSVDYAAEVHSDPEQPGNRFLLRAVESAGLPE